MRSVASTIRSHGGRQVVGRTNLLAAAMKLASSLHVWHFATSVADYCVQVILSASAPACKTFKPPYRHTTWWNVCRGARCAPNKVQHLSRRDSPSAVTNALMQPPLIAVHMFATRLMLSTLSGVI